MTSTGQASRLARRAGPAAREATSRRSAWQTLRRNPIAMMALAGLMLVILAVLLAPVITTIPPNAHDYEHLLEPPSRTHPFGTDDLGRDILSRVLWGGRESLRVAVMAVVVAMGGGIVVGLVAGYFGGWVDNLIMRVVDVFLAFPSILFLLTIVAALGPGLGTVLIALGISAIPAFSRLVRGSVLAARNYEYVTAARVMGAGNGYIMFTQILPNILSPLIIYATVGLGGAILTTAGLSYIGLGAQPPSPEWGAMLNAGRTHLRDAWWLSVFPGLAIFVAVLCVNLLSDGLRDALDPRLRL
ncbi:MAG: ABC transporter permease [Anaerolineae bacterium]|nr:ABC transporter permease [Anaerolineae bacterium]